MERGKIKQYTPIKYPFSSLSEITESHANDKECGPSSLKKANQHPTIQPVTDSPDPSESQTHRQTSLCVMQKPQHPLSHVFR